MSNQSFMNVLNKPYFFYYSTHTTVTISMFMRFILFICLLLSTIVEVSASKNQKKRNFHQDKKDESKKEITKEEKEQLSKLSIRAKRMLIEGEGFRNSTNISGTVSHYQTQCPICSHTFKAMYVARQLPEKGMDPDFCKHTANPSAYDYNIWTCSSCGYSNFPHIYHIKPKAFENPEFSKKQKETMRQLFIKYLGVDVNKLGYSLDQADIPTFMKYFLFKLSIPESKFSNRLLADFHLHYSWVHRQRFLSPIVHPNLSIPVSVFNEKLKTYAKRTKIHNITSKPELVLTFLKQARLDADQNTEIGLSLHYQAKCWDRLGHPKISMHLMKKAIASTINSNLRKILINKKRILVDEFEQSKLALKHIKLALRENAYGKETPQFVYLVGQLSKRLELNNLAHLWIDASVKLLPYTSKPTLNLAQKQKTKLPLFLDNESLDMDRILINTIVREYSEKYIEGDQQNNPKFELKEVNNWLYAMEKACVKYYTELDFDPKNLKELVEVGLLKSYPRLSKEAIRFFKVEINQKNAIATNRYKLSSIIPYEDKEGLFWPSISHGKISRLRQ
jgi:hypothetical protein